MEKFSLDLYNLNEWLLMRMFRVITGVKASFNPNLEKIYLFSVDNVKEEIMQLVEDQISDEFGIHVKPLNFSTDYKKMLRGKFVNTSRLSMKLKDASREKDAAIMGVTNFWLVPTNFLTSRILHSFSPILGITYVMWGICFLSTLTGNLKKEIIQFSTKHEVGHLLGKHGYPLAWLQKKKEIETKKRSND